MDQAPGLLTVVGEWRVDLPWAFALGGTLLAYLLAFRRASARGQPHPRWRLALFSLGTLVSLLAVVSPVASYASDLLWVDFTGFLLLTMIAPPLLLLGAPLTLAFRVSGSRGRRRLRIAYRSKPVSVLTFPVITWLLFAVATYLWQFTSLTETAVREPAVRYVQHATLLLVGLLFWMPAIAADPMRWRLPYPLRSLYIFVEMTHKGLFGGMFLSMTSVMHEGFARAQPSWAPDAILDQRIAILILWIGGNLIFLVALVGLVLGWVAYEQRNQHRTDYRLRAQREARARRRAALDQVFQKNI